MINTAGWSGCFLSLILYEDQYNRVEREIVATDRRSHVYVHHKGGSQNG